MCSIDVEGAALSHFGSVFLLAFSAKYAYSKASLDCPSVEKSKIKTNWGRYFPLKRKSLPPSYECCGQKLHNYCKYVLSAVVNAAPLLSAFGVATAECSRAQVLLPQLLSRFTTSKANACIVVV
jgi:hypothetical protein